MVINNERSVVIYRVRMNVSVSNTRYREIWANISVWVGESVKSYVDMCDKKI